MPEIFRSRKLTWKLIHRSPLGQGWEEPRPELQHPRLHRYCVSDSRAEPILVGTILSTRVLLFPYHTGPYAGGQPRTLHCPPTSPSTSTVCSHHPAIVWPAQSSAFTSSHLSPPPTPNSEDSLCPSSRLQPVHSSASHPLPHLQPRSFPIRIRSQFRITPCQDCSAGLSAPLLPAHSASQAPATPVPAGGEHLLCSTCPTSLSRVAAD